MDDIIVSNDRKSPITIKVIEQGTGVAAEYDATATVVIDGKEMDIRLGTDNLDIEIEQCLQKMNAGMKGLCCYSDKEVEVFLKTLKNPIKPYDLDIDDKLSTAEAHRLVGNEFFKSKEYQKAISRYQCALKYSAVKYGLGPREQEQLAEASAPIQNNLAAIAMIQNRYHDCIEHTTDVLRSQPENVKALTRRLKALTSVHEYDRARGDLQKLTDIDPQNPDLANLKYQIEATIAKGERSNKKAFSKMFQ
eukprot:TRINITY_DN6947_c0_g1_i3.p1 TRINITY_DN6947_c0_g1~~TRINITY_DN6947_c0_g1_i3.p1  ORF type:complete len:270 (+),score=60.67 TRINITY_DN6947_c0_g1_i3:64-810(+)